MSRWWSLWERMLDLEWIGCIEWRVVCDWFSLLDVVEHSMACYCGGSFVCTCPCLELMGFVPV